MSLDTKITQALEQAAGELTGRPGIWPVVRAQIHRSRRRRRMGFGAAILFAVTMGLFSYSVVDRGPQPVTGEGPATISPRSGGFRLSYPAGWTGRTYDNMSVVITPDLATPDGSFKITSFLEPQEYDHRERDPGFMFQSRGGGRTAQYTSVTVAGHPAERVDVSPYDSSKPAPSPGANPPDRILYFIDWPASQPQCEAGGPCRLVVDLEAMSPQVMQQYRSDGEEIVQGVEVAPSKALTPIPDVQAKIPLKAGPLTTGAGFLWALSYPDNDYHLDKLYRIDPDTNRINASADVGYLPSAVAADGNGVWVANKRACDVISDCADSKYPTTDLPGPPAQSSVTRFDPRTLDTAAVIPIRNPEAIALGAGGVWVIDTANGVATLIRIDLATDAIVARVKLSGSGYGVSPQVDVVDGSVWASAAGKLDRIDPATNTISATFTAPGQMITPVPQGHSMWFAAYSATTPSLVEFDTQTGVVVGEYPSESHYRWVQQERSIWSVGGIGALRRFDTVTKKLDDPAYFGGSPASYGIAAGFNSIWVGLDDGMIWRIAE